MAGDYVWLTYNEVWERVQDFASGLLKLDLVPEIELTSNDLLIDLARIGLGIAFVPDYCITEPSDDLFLLKTKEELPCRELAVAYNDQIPLSRASMEFLSYFQNDSM